MRRSAAPSQLAEGTAAKRPCFNPPFLAAKQTESCEALPVKPQVQAPLLNYEGVEKLLDSKEQEISLSGVTGEGRRSAMDILSLIEKGSSNKDINHTAKNSDSNHKLNGFLEQASSKANATIKGSSFVSPIVHSSSSSSKTSSSSTQISSTGQVKNSDQNSSSLNSNSVNKVNKTDDEDDGQPARYLSVMWAKLSKKKHKKWEGDAILIAKGRTVRLVDMDGKEIARGTGYKTSELMTLADGQMLVIGGKEIEVMGVLPEDQYNTGKCFESTSTRVEPTNHVAPSSNTSSSRPSAPPPASKPFVRPVKDHGASNLPVKMKPDVRLKPLHDPNAPNALVLPRPPDSHQWQHNHGKLPVVDVVVDPHIVQQLRPHQREGVVFLYQCLLGMKACRGYGAILADEMGLGKTLQCIAVLWTLYKQGPYGGKPMIRKTVIITPGSLVKNWSKEFKKWLSSERLSVFAVGPDKKVENDLASAGARTARLLIKSKYAPKLNKYQFKFTNKLTECVPRFKDFVDSSMYPVLIISYEMFMRSVEILKKVKFDLLICDEGHRLKNANIKTTTLVNGMNIARRIVLTGTPLQNDLQELYAIADFTNPGVLGTFGAFRHVYEEPILASRKPDATTEATRLGQNRASELSRITGMFILRRTQEINNKYLPPRVDLVLFCSLTALQRRLYTKLLSSRAIRSCLTGGGSGGGASDGPAQHLCCIDALKKLCNHPQLIYADSAAAAALAAASTRAASTSGAALYGGLLPMFDGQYFGNPLDVKHSGKLVVLESLLSCFVKAAPVERVVIMSNYTKTLDLLETLCKRKVYQFLRLDGQTPTSKRMELVEKFNNQHSQYFIFLLSTKAGGVGLNLVGASRLILYDIDWNPANDIQAMARVWRDGQSRRTFVYRLLSAGSIEEKMYQRQVSKQSLSGLVVDSRAMENQAGPSFSPEQLRELFTLGDESVMCATHDLLNCYCKDGRQAVTRTNSDPGGSVTRTNSDPGSSAAESEHSAVSSAAARSCQLMAPGSRAKTDSKNISMDELLQWRHVCGPNPNLSLVDPLTPCGISESVSYVFWTESNSPLIVDNNTASAGPKQQQQSSAASSSSSTITDNNTTTDSNHTSSNPVEPNTEQTSKTEQSSSGAHVRYSPSKYFAARNEIRNRRSTSDSSPDKSPPLPVLSPISSVRRSSAELNTGRSKTTDSARNNGSTSVRPSSQDKHKHHSSSHSSRHLGNSSK